MQDTIFEQVEPHAFNLEGGSKMKLEIFKRSNYFSSSYIPLMENLKIMNILLYNGKRQKGFLCLILTHLS